MSEPWESEWLSDTVGELAHQFLDGKPLSLCGCTTRPVAGVRATNNPSDTRCYRYAAFCAVCAQVGTDRWASADGLHGIGEDGAQLPLQE